jgi:hypothetical protein
MSKIGSMLQFPVIGSKTNWGAKVNENFRIIEQEIHKIYTSFNTLKSSIGAEIPYVKVDEKEFFVDLYIFTGKIGESIFFEGKDYIVGSVILKTFPKSKEGECKDSYTYDNRAKTWSSQLPLFLAMYVRNIYQPTSNDKSDEPNEGPIPENEVVGPEGIMRSVLGDEYKRGDLIVRTQEFGSIYGDYTAMSFKKYPPMGEYFIPKIQAQPYRAVFEKTDYVTWFEAGTGVADEEGKTKHTLSYSLPAIGFRAYNYFCYKPDFANLENSLLSVNGSEKPNYITVNGKSELNMEYTDSKKELTIRLQVKKYDNNYVTDIVPSFEWYLTNEHISSPDVVKNIPIFIAYSYDCFVDSEDSSLINYCITVDTTGLENGEELRGNIFFAFKENFIITGDAGFKGAV